MCVYVCVSVMCGLWILLFFFFKQKTAYEMRISDWSSDVCSSDLLEALDAAFLTRTLEEWREAFTDWDAPWEVIQNLRELVSDPQEIGRASCRERVCQYV